VRFGVGFAGICDLLLGGMRGNWLSLVIGPCSVVLVLNSCS
jgi:hypothetical protein